MNGNGSCMADLPYGIIWNLTLPLDTCFFSTENSPPVFGEGKGKLLHRKDLPD